MAAKLRVILLGAGAMARKHADAYRALGTVDMVAVANRGESRAQRFAADYDIPAVFTDFDRALESVEADIASVCVPTNRHPELAIAAMEHGLHVVTEKPIALTSEDARSMIETSRKVGRKLTVIFNRRFNAVWDELNRRIGSIGTPLIYNAQEVRSIRPKLPMHSKSGNGGPVIDCCVHDFDMLLHLFGAPSWVFATGQAFGGNKPFLSSINDIAIDTAHITVEFAAGHRAYLLYAWGFPVGSDYWQYREFMGPDGIVRLMGEHGQEVHHYRADGLREVVHDIPDRGHQEIIRRFVEAIRDDGPVPVDPEDALASLRVSLAAMESIETGEKVAL